MERKHTNYLKEFIFGGISGSIAVLISHPFFTLKTAIQNKEILPQKFYFNRKWIYSGMLRSMIGYSLEKMLVFGVYNSLRNNDINITVSGAISGVAASFCSTPCEQLTIDKQKSVKLFKINHLYSALFPTMVRESLGFSIHFTTYEFLTNKINKEKNILKTMLCGACSIICAISIIYPIDTLKTQIQTGNFNRNTFKFRDSFKGIHYGLLRAVPFHVTCFVVMEELKKIMKMKIFNILKIKCQHLKIH